MATKVLTKAQRAKLIPMTLLETICALSDDGILAVHDLTHSLFSDRSGSHVRNEFEADTQNGFVLVPVQPTREMIGACRQALKRHIESFPESERYGRWGAHTGDHGFKIPAHEKAIVRWRAMVAARPTD